jgi:hypothetical protein
VDKVAIKIGLYLLTVHYILFIVFIINVNDSHDPQSPLLWVFFSIIDFPISMLYFFGKSYSNILNSFGSQFFSEILYLPYVVHGLLGAVWWYFLPRLVTPKKLGGVWGKNK